MKAAVSLLALTLAACGPADIADEGEAISCAVGGADAFTADCRLVREQADGRPAFIVRHPDGAFRRLVTSADGQNLEAADGAETSQSALKDGRFEVILGGDRYVIPLRTDGPPA